MDACAYGLLDVVELWPSITICFLFSEFYHFRPFRGQTGPRECRHQHWHGLFLKFGGSNLNVIVRMPIRGHSRFQKYEPKQ
jgi:hypothetical protein